ncbi:MAG TPA: beta-galactosidase [Phycisphaerae bacterium]|nr:beta-galactosidase [Phycisphaerae bacterium]
MEFGTWYQINCETEDTWRDDFARIRDTGFDFVVLWNMPSYRPGTWEGDVTQVVHQSAKTLRALDEVGRAGLRASLGVWHPYCIGRVPANHRLRWADGAQGDGPNIFNEQWIRRRWLPYVRKAAKRFAGHRAYRGLYFDDTFPVLPSRTGSYLSYAPADVRRFQAWLRRRYLGIENLNMRLKLSKGYRSFEAVRPPRSPQQCLALWTDWTDARAEWCEDFARLTCEAYRTVDGNAAHELVLSDQDYHMHCSPLQYGVDYRRLVRHFDRFEIYMAADHTRVTRPMLLADVRRVVDRGLEIAGGKPFQFHTWFADPVGYRPMRPALLRAMVECAMERGAQVIEVYTFKVHDWRLGPVRGRTADGLPCFREVSLKHNPRMLRCLQDLISRAR